MAGPFNRGNTIINKHFTLLYFLHVHQGQLTSSEVSNLIWIYTDCSKVDTMHLGQIKNKCVSGNGLKILGRVGRHTYFKKKSGNKNNFMHFENVKKILHFTKNLGRVGLP